MACIGGDVFVQEMLASSQGAYGDVDGDYYCFAELAEMDGSGTKTGPRLVSAVRASGGSRVEVACPLGRCIAFMQRLRTRNYEESRDLGDLGVISEYGRRGARRCANVVGGDRRLLAPPGSGDQQASPSSSGGARTLPSGVGKPAIVVVRNKGPPNLILLLLLYQLLPKSDRGVEVPVQLIALRNDPKPFLTLETAYFDAGRRPRGTQRRSSS
ncbi:hypothetical protein B0H14DRAFT_2592829 [Mycena olivaceomarginata]|nr:hypothetical protein B0H14DRAFT_2592829 [Mycena olivaceomarginata]